MVSNLLRGIGNKTVCSLFSKTQLVQNCNFYIINWNFLCIKIRCRQVVFKRGRILFSCPSLHKMWWNYRKINCWTTGHRTTFWSDIVHIRSIFVPNFQFLSRTANWDLQNFAYELILVPNSDCLSPIWIAGITTKASTWNRKWKKYTDVTPVLIKYLDGKF